MGLLDPLGVAKAARKAVRQGVDLGGGDVSEQMGSSPAKSPPRAPLPGKEHVDQTARQIRRSERELRLQDRKAERQARTDEEKQEARQEFKTAAKDAVTGLGETARGLREAAQARYMNVPTATEVDAALPLNALTDMYG